MKNILRNRKVWALAISASLIPAMASAQQPVTPTPTQPVAPQPAAAQPQQAPPAADRYVVGQAIPEPTPGTTMMPLTLDRPWTWRSRRISA